MLDVVEFGEKAAGVGRAVAVEFVASLLAEIRAVHEEEDAAGLGVFDEAIGERAGGEGLPRARGHVDERARAVFGERLFQSDVRFDLALPHASRNQRVRDGHRLQPGAEGVWLGGPIGECLGTMECEDTA